MIILAAVGVLLQGSAGVDSILALASHGPASALASEVRKRPDGARVAFSRLLSLGVFAPDESSRENRISSAQRLASIYASAWGDPFLEHQVGRFRRWSPDARRRKLVADSLRLAGNAAYGQLGPTAARRIWRTGLRESVALGDSAGEAATLGNIGASYIDSAELDSAQKYLELSRDLADRIGDVRTLGNAVGSLASVEKDRGQLMRARELYALAATLRPKSGDTRGEAADRNNIGLIEQELGDWAAARAAFEAALALNTRDNRDAPSATNLVNLATLATIAADFGRASSLYHRALAHFRSVDDRVGAAEVLYDIALLESRRGDYPRARTVLEEAVAIFGKTGPIAKEVAARSDLAAIHAELGDFDAAIGQLRDAERVAPAIDDGRPARARLALSRADLSVVLNQLTDAEHWYRRAGDGFREAGDEVGVAAADAGLAQLLLFRDDYSGAVRALEAALRRRVVTKEPRGAASTSLLLGYALLRQRDSTRARAVLTDVRSRYTTLHDPVGVATALAMLGELDVDAGNWRQAEQRFRQGISQLGTRPAPLTSAGLHTALGVALRRRGALDEAARELRIALTSTEQMAGTIRLDDRRAAFLSDKWDAYTELALLELARGRLADAFMVSERVRDRQTLELLARGRIATPTRGGDSLTNLEQDLRRRMNELSRALAPVDVPTRTLRGVRLTSGSSERVREDLMDAQRRYSELLQTVREKDPAYATLVTPRTASWSTVAAGLESDQALLEYLVTDSTTLVFVISRESLIGLDLGIGRKAIASLVDFTRSALSRPPSQRGSTQMLWRSPLGRLHAWLLAPIERTGLLRGKRSLVVVPHVELHYLPFGALLDASDGTFAAARYEITYAPSATLWSTPSKRRASARVEDVLALAPRPRDLPATRGEVAAIQEAFGRQAQVLVGHAASESAFKAAAGGKSIVHLATSGVLNKHNPLFSFIELAPSAHEDGRLEVHEVFGLTLQARLVVLSACQTGLGAGALADVPAGDDWVGLVNGFLVAGASEVMATLWPVEDRATSRLMTNFYKEIAGSTRDAAALARAQRAALRDPATADPFYWAGFTLVGRKPR